MIKPKLTIKGLVTTLTAILCVAVFVLCINLAEVDFSLTNNTRATGDDYIKVIDVGQGESILIVSNGLCALIDTGTQDSTLDLKEAIYESGADKIDVLILSHLHIDHTGGVSAVFEDFEVQNLILPELSTFSEGIYSAQLAIDKVTRAGGNVYSAVQGMNFHLGNFEITVLMKFTGFIDENNRSLIIMAEKQGKKFLFTGDCEAKAEKALLKQSLNLECDVLKVAHHGSSTSSTDDFLNACNPKFAVISCGKDNSYGHPHRETLNALEKRKIPVYQTDKQGDITFFVDKEITVKTEK